MDEEEVDGIDADGIGILKVMEQSLLEILTKKKRPDVLQTYRYPRL